MRLISILLATAAMVVASSAGAVELSLVGASATGVGSVTEGQDITIELRMTNNSNEDGMYGLGASAHQYAPGLSFVSGNAVRRYSLGTDTPFANLSGTQTGSGATIQRVLAESEIGANGKRVQIALSADVSAHVLDGLNTPDAGLPGTAAGGAMFRLVFRGVTAGTYTILFDSSYQGDLVNLDPLGNPNSSEIAGTSFTVTVTPIPEPGTALLMGLGLAGLAAAGRRE